MAIMSSARRTEPITVAELDLAPSYPGAKVELIRGVIVISPPNEGYTKQHLDGLPDDGRRHELVDGLLLVTPAPTPEHQFLVVGVLRALLADCPTGLRVVVAPLDVELTPHDVVQQRAGTHVRQKRSYDTVYVERSRGSRVAGDRAFDQEGDGRADEKHRQK